MRKSMQSFFRKCAINSQNSCVTSSVVRIEKNSNFQTALSSAQVCRILFKVNFPKKITIYVYLSSCGPCNIEG